MSTDIPDHEPVTIQAGDTLTWSKSLADYPADDGWTLSYRLINSLVKYDITSAASGSDHLVTATASATALYTPGQYTLFGWVSKSSERYSMPSIKVQVLPNLATQTTYDIRTPAKKILDLLDAAMLSHGAKAWVESYEIEGRSMRFRSVGDFIAYRSKIKQEVIQEEAAERLRSGLSGKNRISVRF